LFVLFTVIPAGVAWLIERSASAELELRRRRADRAAHGARWSKFRATRSNASSRGACRFPAAGFSFVMRSGERLRHVVPGRRSEALLYELADRGSRGRPRTLAVRHPVVVWAHAKAVVARHVLGSRRRQSSSRSRGARALRSTRASASLTAAFSESTTRAAWASGLRHSSSIVLTAALYLVLYASLLRGRCAESFALAGSERGSVVRHSVARAAWEVAYRVLFYGGVVAMLLLRHTA
jgi:hypothetical protein